VYIWSLAEKKLVRKFKSPSSNKQLEHNGFDKSDAYMNGEDEEIMEVFDIGWSCDGSTVAAGLQRSILLLDINKILSQPASQLLMDSEGGCEAQEPGAEYKAQ